jgi:3',5'-cyclic AMP phosphodiesterase CpdA
MGTSSDEEEILPREGPDYPAGRFMVASDLHHLSPELWNDGPAFRQLMSSNDGKLTARSAEVLTALEAAARREEPAFLVVTGDLTFNGARRSHEEVAASFARIEEAGIPVYAVPGNHDINNPWASRFHGQRSETVPAVDPAEFREIYAGFGYREAVSEDPESLAYAIRRPSGLRLLLLDSNQYSRNADLGYPDSAGSIGPVREQWLRSRLETRRADTPTLLFFHHNLLAHERNPGPVVPKWIDTWPRYARLFWDNAAPTVFTGHSHLQDIAGLRGEQGEWIYDVATGSFSTFPHSYRIVDIGDDRRMRIYGRRAVATDFPDGAGNILRYSRDSYIEHFMRNFGRNLAETSSLGFQRAADVGAYAALISLQHDAGEELGMSIAELAPQAYELWAEYAPQETVERLSDFGSDMPPYDNDIVIDLRRGRWRSLRGPGRTDRDAAAP